MIILDIKVKVLQKGKITIPIEVRERLGIREGDFMTLRVLGGCMILIPPRTVLNPTEVLDGLAEDISIREPVDRELKRAAASRIEKKLQRAEK